MRRIYGEVMEANLVETQNWDSLPYDNGSSLVPKNGGAPVKAGDTIWLRTGYHGEVAIEGAYNSSVITIAAEAGHTPALGSLQVQAASHWTLRGLSISLEHAPTYQQGTIVAVSSHNWSGPAHDVTIEDCTIFSVADVSGWTESDWNALPGNGIQLSGDDCILRGNELLNVNFGISVTGEGALVERNTVTNFAGDGLRGLGDHGTCQYNVIANAYAVNSNHDDGFQSWSVGNDGVGTGEVTGITLRGNTIINYQDPNQPFRGPLQGIGCFDGTFVDWVVENNVIITDHWHGITLLGARNSRIVNNTVVDLNTDSPGPPWISIDDHKDGTPSEGTLVRNNLTTALNLGAEGVTEDHNIIVDDPALHFVDYAGRDLHLIATSPAVDQGVADQAPSFDRDEIYRPQGPALDIGAYEYYEGTPDPPPGTGGGGAGAGGAATGGAGAGAGASGGGGAGSGVTSPEDDGGCGCRGAGRSNGSAAWLMVLALGWLSRTRRAKAG